MKKFPTPLDVVQAGVADYKKVLDRRLKEVKDWPEARGLLMRYFSVFHPHFIVWVSGFQNSASTETGQKAAIDNILLELIENHQAMLYDFMTSLGIKQHQPMYDGMLPIIRKISAVMSYGVAHTQGAGPSVIIYVLEETSKIFIPWMADVAIANGVKDLTYTNKHGEADAEHSLLAFEALKSEFDIHSPTQYEQVKQGFDATIELLSKIFDSY